MSLRGDLSTFKTIKRRLRELPLSVAHDISQRAAPAMTALTRSAYDAAQTVYGDPRPTSTVTGDKLDLYRTGAVAGALKFVANGTILRCVLGPNYSRYLIGKHGILPSGALPTSWRRKLADVVSETKAAGDL